MKFIYLKDEIISIQNVLNITKNEKDRIISINYIIEGKIINYEIDYSEIKENINEEKTIFQKDYEKLIYTLTKKENLQEEKYKKLKEKYLKCKELKEKYYKKLRGLKWNLIKRKEN